jgi:hypothetical protein
MFGVEKADVVLGVTLLISTIRCGLPPFYLDSGKTIAAYDADTLASTSFAPRYRPFNDWLVFAIYGHLTLTIFASRQSQLNLKLVLFGLAFVFAEVVVVTQFVQRAVGEQQSLTGFTEARIPTINYILTFLLPTSTACLMWLERRARVL